MPLSVSEYRGTGGASGNVPTGEAPALTSYDVTKGSTGAELQSGASLVRLCSTEALRFAFVTGTAVAVATDEYLPADVETWRVVRATGLKVSTF